MYKQSILPFTIIFAIVLAARLGVAPALAADDPPLEKFALVVGIDKYKHFKPQLDGSVNDARDVREMLISKFGFPADHVKMLLDEQATHAGIVAAFRSQLIENAKLHKNAVIVFHYSGHGSSRMEKAPYLHADGYESSLVSVDSRDPSGKVFDITADEFFNLLEELGRHTSNTTVILDCCHSGSLARDGDDPKVKVRYVEPDRRPQPASTAAPPRTRGETPSGSFTAANGSGRVVIAACQADEKAREKEYLGRNGKKKINGALTYYLLRALDQRARQDRTYRELMDDVSAALQQEKYAQYQHPQAEGDIRQPLFGRSGPVEDAFILVERVEGNKIQLQGGKAIGLTEGAIVAVYAPEARQLSGLEHRLFTAAVTQADALSATATLPEGKTCPAKAKAVLMSPAFGHDRLRVGLALDPKLASISSALRKAITGDEVASNLLEMEATSVAYVPLRQAVRDVSQQARPLPPANCDAAVLSGEFHQVFPDSSAILASKDSPIPPEHAEVLYVAGRDGNPYFGFFVTPSDKDAADKIARALQNVARQRNFMALENQATGIGQAVEMKIYRVSGKVVNKEFKKEGEKEVSSSTMVPAFEIEDRFELEMRNRTDRPLFATLFDVGTDGAIKIVWPPANSRDPIRPGIAVRTRNIWRITPPTGVERFKLIVTTDHVDFSFLEVEATRRGDEEPLARLVQQSYGGTRSVASDGASDAGAKDWATSTAELNITKKK